MREERKRGRREGGKDYRFGKGGREEMRRREEWVGEREGGVEKKMYRQFICSRVDLDFRAHFLLNYSPHKSCHSFLTQQDKEML